MPTGPTTLEEILKAAAESGDPGLQPAVIFHRNIDSQKITALTGLMVNDDWAPTIKQHLQDGWVAFRMQNELHGQHHVAMLYLAKLK